MVFSWNSRPLAVSTSILGVLGDALALNVAFALHQLQNVGHGGAGNGKIPLDVPLEDRLTLMGVEIFHDPPMHGRALFQPVCPGERVDLAEDEVVYPADLGRDDLRRLPGRVVVGRAAAGMHCFKIGQHKNHPLDCFETKLFQIKLFDSIHIIQQSK